MAVRLRLKLMGRRHRPFYRVAAMDARAKRDGRVIEQFSLKQDRVDYWLSVGAEPSDTVRRLIERSRSASAGS